MAQEQKTIFVSYRRKVAWYIARAVFHELRRQRYNVFIDLESGGDTLDPLVGRQIDARAHFLVILTPRTVERFNEPGDRMRREIERAIEQGRHIVPILAYGFTFAGKEAYLTGKLAQLRDYAGLEIPNTYFKEAMGRLKKGALAQPFEGVIAVVPEDDKPIVQQKIADAAATPVPSEDEISAEGAYDRALSRDSEDLAGKLADYNEAIRLNPQFVQAYINRGDVWRKKGNSEGAIDDLMEAIKLNPESAEAHNNLGAARRAKGDVEGAIESYSEAIRLNPTFKLAYYNRGNAHLQQNDTPSAIADYEAAIKLDPLYTSAYRGLGNCYFEKTQDEEALKPYKRYLELAGKSADPYIVRRVQELEQK